MTIQEIMRKNEEVGYHFFEKSTMRFFRSRVLETVYEGPGGIYFVTSEQFVPSSGPPEPRGYTVRRFNPETGDITKAGEFNKLSQYRAQKRAQEYAEKGVPECGSA
jgi:hypothetical protein